MNKIEQKCLSLSREERQRLINKLMASLEVFSAEKTLEDIHKAVNNAMGCQIITKGRDLEAFVGRTIFTYFACLEGYSENAIGAYLNRDHSTVHYMKNKIKDWFSIPTFYRYENKWYELARKELYETDR